MLKNSKNIESKTQLGKGRVGFGDSSRARRDGSELDRSRIDADEVRDDKVGKKVQKLSKSKNLFKSKKR